MTHPPAIDDDAIQSGLDAYGWTDLGQVLTASECEELAGLYDDDARFRSHIVMARHGFGSGEYKYFHEPPAMVRDLRTTLYARLVGTANAWEEALGAERRFPARHEDFLARCHADGQTRSTPLVLRYREGDYNCLHQDLYGPHVFPIQVVVLLSDPAGFDGGDFVLTEERPRMQSRAEVVQLAQGHAIAFAVNERPKQGKRGVYRVKQRHGVSRIRSGERFTLGVIFHDAE